MKRVKALSWFLSLLIGTALIYSGQLDAGQPDPATLAAQVQKRYQKVQALAANYTRSSRFVAGAGQSAREVEAAGRLIWQRPVSLRMDQAEPREEQVVTTPQGVWWVRAQRKRADLYPMEQFTTGLKSLLDALGGLAKVEEAFNLEQATPEEAAAASGPLLVLSPKGKRVDLKRLVVWFDAKELLLKGFRIISLVGDITEYRLSNLSVNPVLPAETFNFNPPADFQVRDHRPR